MASAQDARRGAPEGSNPRRVAVVPEGLTARRFDTASDSDQSPEVEGGSPVFGPGDRATTRGQLLRERGG